MRRMINLADAARRPALRIILGLGCLLGAAVPQVTQYRFLARMPLDSEIIQLVPAKQNLTMMLTWDCREMEDWQLLRGEKTSVVRDTQGKEVQYYPRELRFRFTISGRTKYKLQRKPLEYETNLEPEAFIKQLSFRLKRFQGLETTVYTATKAELIGVPAEIPFDERIYSIVFNVPKIPIDDRFALEVLDAEGNRVAKFPFFLM
jgi:hypothetical protein